MNVRSSRHLVWRYDDQQLGIYIGLNDHDPRALPVHDVNHEPTLDNAWLVPCGSFQHSADIDFRHATLLGETWITPKGLVSEGLLVNDLPRGARLEICDHVENDVMILDTIPMTIERLGSNQMLVMFDDSGTRKYWDGKVGFKAYMRPRKRQLRIALGKNVTLHYRTTRTTAPGFASLIT